jgi:hypothetical protein
VLQIWKARKAAVSEEIAQAERGAKAIQEKLDRLDEAFLFERSIDIETYDRHAEKLREELTLARIDRHSGQLEELDVEGILAFAERLLPRAADLWVQASLDQRQRFQQLFFPDGIAFDGNRFVGTGVTAPAFSYLREIENGDEGLVGHNSDSWNRVTSWDLGVSKPRHPWHTCWTGSPFARRRSTACMHSFHQLGNTTERFHDTRTYDAGIHQ